MADIDIKKIIGNIDKLPTLPFVVTKLNDLITNPRTSASDIHQIIIKDQALSARILKLVNSAFYGFSQRIASISHAIVILGFNTVKNVALTASVFDMFSKQEGPQIDFDREAFWIHSLAVAGTARLIATKLKIPSVEDVFVAGLLHDVGKVVLDQYVHEKFIEIVEIVKTENILIKDAEEKALDGINHSQIGAWLANNWKLPSGLVKMIALHHRPSLEEPHLVKPIACVHLADILARSLDMGSGGDKRIPMVDSSVWDTLGLTYEDIDSLMVSMENELEDVQAFLSGV